MYIAFNVNWVVVITQTIILFALLVTIVIDAPESMNTVEVSA